MSDKHLHEKIDRIQADIVEIKLTMAENTASLKEHMRRTDILEKGLEPVSRHVAMFNGAMKALGIIAGLISVLYYVLKILGLRT